MLVDTKEIKTILYELKQQAFVQLDRTSNNKVKNAIEARITVLDTLFIWLDQSEKKGEIDMESLQLGLGKVVKLDDIKSASRSKIDPAIIAIAKKLDPGDAEPIDPTKIKWPHFANRVYVLKKEGLVPENVKPLKRGENFYLAKFK